MTEGVKTREWSYGLKNPVSTWTESIYSSKTDVVSLCYEMHSLIEQHLTGMIPGRRSIEMKWTSAVNVLLSVVVLMSMTVMASHGPHSPSCPPCCPPDCGYWMRCLWFRTMSGCQTHTYAETLWRNNEVHEKVKKSFERQAKARHNLHLSLTLQHILNVSSQLPNQFIRQNEVRNNHRSGPVSRGFYGDDSHGWRRETWSRSYDGRGCWRTEGMKWIMSCVEPIPNASLNCFSFSKTFNRLNVLLSFQEVASFNHHLLVNVLQM